MSDLGEKLEAAAIAVALFTIGALGGFAIVGLAKIGLDAMKGSVKTTTKVVRRFIKLNPQE